jgi:hypothetical protein
MSFASRGIRSFALIEHLMRWFVGLAMQRGEALTVLLCLALTPADGNDGGLLDLAYWTC